MDSNIPDMRINASSSQPGRQRKRGGQPGNHNAVKHGFYSAVFKQIESELLASETSTKFEGEIDLLRVLIKRTVDKANEHSDLSLEETFTLLRNISFAAAIIERLNRSKNLHLVNEQEFQILESREG